MQYYDKHSLRLANTCCCRILGYYYIIINLFRWRGEEQLPLRTSNMEQTSGYGLMIRSVGLSDLGPYSCQAYNGGTSRADSSTVNLKVVGPIDRSSISREDQQYLKYVVAAPTYYQPNNEDYDSG